MMNEEQAKSESGEYRGGEDVFTKHVRAGRRTYFFDIKVTKGNDYYLTITESRRRMDSDGKYVYEKHKVFLHKDDFEKFMQGLNEALAYVNRHNPSDEEHVFTMEKDTYTQLQFEDLSI